MPIPTEPIGSVPRPQALIEDLKAHAEGQISTAQLAARRRAAVRDTISQMAATGSPIITDGEQAKPSFLTYPLEGAPNLEPDGVSIEFSDGHHRRLPRLTAGPFRYEAKASAFVEQAKAFTDLPLKQAVIAPSALSLIYPDDGIQSYPRERFLDDLVREAIEDVRGCFDAGAEVVQLDFTEGRLAAKLDPSGELLRSFIELNNRVLDAFSEEQRQRLGVHTCPGGDRDATHSADVDYAELLPTLFDLRAGRFYMQLASEADPGRVLSIVRDHLKPHQRIFVGVIDPTNPQIESPELVRGRVLRAAEYLPIERLGSTDDCGFSPFGDDRSTARERAFDKIRVRVEGTRMAAEELGI